MASAVAPRITGYHRPGMSEQHPLYVGIDLGTSNSAAAVFDGERVEVVRSASGASITPSVVRIDARGNIVVGERARRAAYTDADNVRSEFKRLMGSPHRLRFGAVGVERTPTELSAEVLRALREDVRAQTGVLPQQAVIGVPALFELPQTAATSDAARLAGFERVELIQEPVASAIAAGYRQGESEGAWLVYDLGGGTFDVSLLDTREGLLRVVGHDGDNFLGGRDLDGALVDWVIARLADEHGISLQRSEPEHQRALRRIRVAAEEAKIELTRAAQAEIAVEALQIAGREIDLALTIDRQTFESLVAPLVSRSIDVCVRLLGAHGLKVGTAGSLSRVVLVGGPTAMPYLREQVSGVLGAPFAEALDPMTLVAQGAAMHAASAGLDARGTPSASPAKGVKVWLQHPAMTSDATPYVIGRLVDPTDRQRVAAIVMGRSDGTWSGSAETVDADGTFVTMAQLVPRVRNELSIEGRAADGTPIALSPSTFFIVHGVTLGDPPLSRTIGVALADDHVQTYFERGSPLPMRRTFTLRTVEPLSPADPTSALRVPIVQGEFPLAHLCRMVGTIEVTAARLASPIPAGSTIEVTLDLDRGGRLAASARIAGAPQVFDGVAHLVAGSIPVEAVEPRIGELATRLNGVRGRVFAQRDKELVKRLGTVDEALMRVARDAQAARGGDLDALEKARRGLIEIDGLLAEVEAILSWPELEQRAERELGLATSFVAGTGTSEERRALAAAATALDRARNAKSPTEVERQILVVRRLGDAAYLRLPGALEQQLDYAQSRLDRTSDPRRARSLIEEGRRAAARGDRAALDRAVREIWRLLPPDEAERDLGYGSGVR